MMKFIHKLTIVLALGGICGLAACSDDDQGFLKRNLREMSFPYVESSDMFTIRATGDWQISDAPDSREWTTPTAGCMSTSSRAGRPRAIYQK